MFLFFTFFISISAIGNDKFEKAMSENISKVYASKTIDDYQLAINNLTRIAEAEKDRWEPQYYITYSYIMIAFQEPESTKKDEWLVYAQDHLDKALAIDAKEVELITLQGFIYTAKLTVDPASRGAQYSALSMQKFGEAVSIDPNNPRALLLLGQMQYGTAQFMGSGVEQACQTISKAVEKFESFEPSSQISPAWGKELAFSQQQQCGN
jgi:hypothetical protein